MILHLRCSGCGRTIATHLISAKEVTVEINPCLACGKEAAKDMMGPTIYESQPDEMPLFGPEENNA